MKIDQNSSTLPLRQGGSVRLGGLRNARVDANSVRRREAIRAFYADEVAALRALGEDYVALRRGGGLVLN